MVIQNNDERNQEKIMEAMTDTRRRLKPWRSRAPLARGF